MEHFKTKPEFDFPEGHTEKEKCHGKLRFCGNCDFSGSFPGEQEQSQLSAILTVG